MTRITGSRKRGMRLIPGNRAVLLHGRARHAKHAISHFGRANPPDRRGPKNRVRDTYREKVSSLLLPVSRLTLPHRNGKPASYDTCLAMIPTGLCYLRLLGSIPPGSYDFCLALMPAVASGWEGACDGTFRNFCRRAKPHETTSACAHPL